jgi:hypothetical protein
LAAGSSGLVGLVLALECEAKKVLITDGNPTAVANILV